jgi:hypothetical protein
MRSSSRSKRSRLGAQQEARQIAKAFSFDGKGVFEGPGANSQQ